MHKMLHELSTVFLTYGWRRGVTDKGDTIVIMDTSHLAELAHKYLSDVNTYRLLKNDPTPKVVVKFNQYILDCLHKRVISQKEYDRYAHTNNVLSAQDTQMPYEVYGRLSHVQTVLYTCRASAFLDKLLQPYMKSTKSYLKNSTQLVNILADKRFPTN